MLHAEIDARQPEARNMPEGGAGAAGLMGAEIWAQVAQHLEVREWARVAGTCRATWDVQLNSINARAAPPGRLGTSYACQQGSLMEHQVPSPYTKQGLFAHWRCSKHSHDLPCININQYVKQDVGPP